ncbi:MAG: hypothetical protein ACK5PF_09565 [bacterium]
MNRQQAIRRPAGWHSRRARRRAAWEALASWLESFAAGVAMLVGLLAWCGILLMLAPP